MPLKVPKNPLISASVRIAILTRAWLFSDDIVPSVLMNPPTDASCSVMWHTVAMPKKDVFHHTIIKKLGRLLFCLKERLTIAPRIKRILY